jgi:hypothetical protein
MQCATQYQHVTLRTFMALNLLELLLLLLLLQLLLLLLLLGG